MNEHDAYVLLRLIDYLERTTVAARTPDHLRVLAVDQIAALNRLIERAAREHPIAFSTAVGRMGTRHVRPITDAQRDVRGSYHDLTRRGLR